MASSRNNDLGTPFAAGGGPTSTSSSSHSASNIAGGTGTSRIKARKLATMDAVCFTEQELEFLAEDEQITIIPNFHMDSLELVGCDVGPFTPNTQTEVPLWLAIKLKKAQKCRVKPPEWMSAENLVDRLEQEREDSMFQDISFHYVEMAKLLLQNASDDFENAERIRGLIKNIEDTREEKIRNGLKQISGKTTTVVLDNVSCMEINNIRAYACKTMKHFSELSKAAGTMSHGEEDDLTQSQSTPYRSTPSSQSRTSYSNHFGGNRENSQNPSQLASFDLSQDTQEGYGRRKFQRV